MNVTQYPMKSGRKVGEDGNVYNVAEIMAKASGAKPLDGVSADVTQYDNESGRVVGENGNVYNMVELIAGLAAASAAFEETGLTVVNGQLCQTYTNEEG